ncbi:MAG: 1-acyl-sn-glycerol-3-phosphate acyltransferase [Lachnospiraceae bacterium]|nr:1-acyl-sn-glycerol-3-phosphate acyltransferase [Lachnospiraceae bacterium]
MIRFIILLLLVIFYLIITIPIWIIALILRLFNKHAATMIGRGIANFGFFVAKLMAGIKLKLEDMDKVPDSAVKKVVFIGNHRSFFDIILSNLSYKGPLGFVAKKELLLVPSLNVWMYLINCRFIDRKNMKQSIKVLTDACEDVNRGFSSMMIFPEGTRNKGKEGTILKFHSAALKIAVKAGCTIVPVGISNSRSVFEAQFPALKPSTVVIRYGDPIDTSALSAEEKKNVADTVSVKVQELLDKNMGLY